jgi:general secretion pathway protein M
MTALRQHWEQMQPRERRIVVAGGAATLVLLLYALVWDPLTTSLGQMEQNVTAQRATLAWMQQAAVEARALRGTQGTGSAGRSLLALSDESAKAHKLGTAVKRVQPDGQHTVRIWLEDAAFADLLRWLDTLASRHGVKISGLTVERVPAAPARVNARVVLEMSP